MDLDDTNSYWPYLSPAIEKTFLLIFDDVKIISALSRKTGVTDLLDVSCGDEIWKIK